MVSLFLRGGEVLCPLFVLAACIQLVCLVFLCSSLSIKKMLVSHEHRMSLLVFVDSKHFDLAFEEVG